MAKTIPPDSTVASVFAGLTNKDKYVRWALQKMRECNKAHGDSTIRIGVSGTGGKPSYQVRYLDDGDVEVFGSYQDNGDPLSKPLALSTNWSSAEMGFEELLNFYSDAIGYQGKRI